MPSPENTVVAYTRRTRIVRWTDDMGTRGYTLVLEWFKDGECVRDERHQMGLDEFRNFMESARLAQQR